MNASSDASAGYAAAARARALFLGGARGSSGFAERVPNSAGVDVPGLPFFAAAPVRHCGSVVNQKRVHVELAHSRGQIQTSLGRLGCHTVCSRIHLHHAYSCNRCQHRVCCSWDRLCCAAS